MSKRGLAALYQVVSNGGGSHLDDETLAIIADAEIAGQDIELLFGPEIEHIESCEHCAEAYGELIVMLQSAVDELGQELRPAAENSSQPVIAALDIATIWRGIFSLSAERIGRSVRLSLSPEPVTALREPAPAYGNEDVWRLPEFTVEGPPTRQLSVSFSLQSPKNCDLQIIVQKPDGTPLANQIIQIHYPQVTKTAETTPSGTAYFDQIPIVTLPKLTITL